MVNGLDADDDIIINGNSVSKTIDVAASESAQSVAAKINAVSGDTGVTATAKAYAFFYSMSYADETISVNITNKPTGDFVFSSSNITDALDKINAISGTTGVTATANSANLVVLYSANGADILVENEKASTKLRVKTGGHDGISQVVKQATHSVGSTAAELADSTAHTITNNTTGQTRAFSTGADGTETASTYSTKINDVLGANVGTKANRVSTANVTAIATGDYYLKHYPTGDVFKLEVGAATGGLDCRGCSGDLLRRRP